MGKVLVTGADGMLGNSVCRELLSRGYKVRAMSLNKKCSQTIIELPVEIVYGNILDANFVKSAIESCDYVIHIAAMTDVWPRRSEMLRKVNIIGTQIIAEEVMKSGVKRMVHIGSASSFKEGPKDNPGTEKSPYGSAYLGFDYTDSKYEAQEYLIKEYSENRLPVIIVNPTYMIGPYDSGPSSGRMVLELAKGGIPGYSGGGKNFVYSGDVAVAVVNALSKGKVGECYIAGCENLEYKEFFIKACNSLGIKFSLRKMPYQLVLLAGLFQSLIARITGKPPRLSYGMAKFAAIEQYYDSSKAIDELEMPQTPIEEGIKSLVEWFRENGYLTKA